MKKMGEDSVAKKMNRVVAEGTLQKGCRLLRSSLRDEKDEEEDGC